MTDRPYHHGHLRDTLLAEAERTLREQGVEQLSLRDLARQAGVSHAAPRRHFADRQALLGALAAAGFARLADEVAAAIEAAGPDFPARLLAADEAAADELAAGVGRLFTMVGELIKEGQQTGQLPPGDPERIRLLFMAIARGIAELVIPGGPGAGQADGLLDDAVALFTRGRG
jgi:AcrR family transcriptional regulator